MSKIIDISHHQGDIDWSQACNDVDLAIIRIQYGTSTIDRKYLQNIEGCTKYKIPFGVYIYVTYKNVAEALVQAEDFYNRASAHHPLFYVVDVEESFGASIQNFVQGTQAFIDYIKSKGVKVGLFYKPYRMDTIKNNDFLWIPRYNGASGPGKKPDFACDVWQYTDKGVVQGIKGNVDLSFLNGHKPLAWFIAANDHKKELTFAQYEELKNENNQLKQELANISMLLAGKAESISTMAVATTHREDWAWVIEEGIIKDDGKNLNPKGALTREQMATILKRYHDNKDQNC